MVQEKVTFVNEESNLSPTYGEHEQSPDDEPDQVPGQIKQPDSCMAINEGKVLNENLRSDELSEHVDEIQEVKAKEDEGNPEIKKVKKTLEKNLQSSSKEETNLSATLSYFVEKTPCISFSFAFLLLTCVPALSVRTEKKALLLSTSVFLVQLLMVTASPIQITNHTPNEYEYKILQTPLCNGIRFMRPHKCERNEKMFNIYIEFCGFATMCDPEFKPICIDGDEDEALYFCSPKVITCKKGYRRKVRKKEADSDLVIVQEEKCPPGTYQPSESDCYNSCANRHENLEDLPNQYAVYSNGDNAFQTERITPVQIENTFSQNWHVTVIIVMVIAALLFTVGSIVVICCTRKGSTCM
ncbi:uncharacterized protein LOC132713252 [Ruditapes philippinarum]|uniref:uncharacterized protein LOC132713252 n=1 Tax=Ruditapes philippinarum TaxID=129788 RepID=UPI00295AEA55|nr:uncharacterized protein LOC132713252 [Ruditapes philippinarum]